MPIDRDALAAFLTGRRRALQPEDVGLPRGPRRRTEGLRREEVAALAYMSTDYYARLERPVDTDHVAPGLLRIVDRLVDTPAEVVNELGETLVQTPVSAALTGDARAYLGLDRSLPYRWFTDPSARLRYAQEDRKDLARLWVSSLRGLVGVRGPDSRAAHIVDELSARSEEFRELWERGEVGLRPRELKRFAHPEVGLVEVSCQTLIDPEDGHWLLVYTAEPGSESADKLALLAVIGSQSLA